MKEGAVAVIFKLNYFCSVCGLIQSKEIGVRPAVTTQLYHIASFVTLEKSFFSLSLNLFFCKTDLILIPHVLRLLEVSIVFGKEVYKR